MTLLAQSVCPSDTTCPKQLSYHIPLTFPQQLAVSANLPPVIAYKQDEASLTQVNHIWGACEEN